jgi:group I intron endonuclease
MAANGIYKIQSITKPQRIYIGSSININRRWREHKNELKLNTHSSAKLQNHCNKYGITDLRFSIILHGCRNEDLLFLEQAFIDNFNPYFNCCKVAGSCLGVKRTKETLAKQKKYWDQKKANEEYNKKQFEPNFIFEIQFKNHNQEMRLKMRNKKIGKPSPILGKHYKNKRDGTKNKNHGYWNKDSVI